MKITHFEKDALFLQKTIAGLTEQIDALDMLQDMSRQIVSKYDFNQIMDMFLDIVKEVVNYNSCIVYLYQEDSKSYEAVGSRGVSENDLKSYEVDDAVINWVFKEGRWTDISLLEHSHTKNNGSVSMLPLQGVHRDLGFLLMSYDSENEVFNQTNMKLLSYIASQTGIALENHDLYSKLNYSREYIINILESINSGIITIDMADKITQINKNATAMLGLPSADIIGENYKDVLAKDVVTLINRVKKRAQKDGFAFETQFEYVPIKYLKIPLGISASLLLDGKDNRIGITFIFRDMSASKEIERLRQLDEMKNEFVSNVSHELKTPLSAIKSHVEAILDQVDPDDYQTQREFLTVVNNETDRLAALINDLLEISRIESGKFEMSLKPTSLPDIIEIILKNIEHMSSTHQIIVDIPLGLPDLLVDKDKMMQAFINLLDNAIKFSPDGGKISIKARVKRKKMECSISDQGIGISEKDISHIFEKFYRVDNSDVYEIPGTGLGLPIVKHIIESQGGRISVKSGLVKGSTFTVLLPLTK